MKRFALPTLLLAIFLMLTIKQSTVALYNHPSLADAMVNPPLVRTATYMTGYDVPTLRFNRNVAEPEARSEGRKVLTIVREYKHTNRREVF